MSRLEDIKSNAERARCKLEECVACKSTDCWMRDELWLVERVERLEKANKRLMDAVATIAMGVILAADIPGNTASTIAGACEKAQRQALSELEGQ